MGPESWLEATVKFNRKRRWARMDAQYFTMNVHHGGYFTLNPRQYMGGAVRIVDNCNAEMCLKCEIKSVCKQFGYTSLSNLWYRMPSVNLENASFHMIVNNNDAMFMADLVAGYGEIDLFVEHPIDEPIEVEVEEIHSRSLELGKEPVIVTDSGESDREEEDAALMHLNQNSDGGDSWDSDDDVVEQVEQMGAEVKPGGGHSYQTSKRAWILKFRGKPIISMLEDIRLYLMGRFQLNKETILKFESELCTKNMWQSTRLPFVQPPIKRRPPGRPKKSRVKEPDEPTCHTKLRRVGVPKKCKACGRLGHNKRSCKGEVRGNSSLPGAAKKPKRKRTNTKNGHEGGPSGGSPTIEPNQTSAPPTTSEAEFPCAPPNSNATTSTPSTNSCRGSTKSKKRTITDETLRATTNASRYMDALRFSESQSFMHGPGLAVSGDDEIAFGSKCIAQFQLLHSLHIT
nr:hypothetical protein CFP56_51819 [Quercus suber]